VYPLHTVGGGLPDKKEELGAHACFANRETFATMNLSAGEHYMQVSKWLGHSTFVLTLNTYAETNRRHRKSVEASP
jgi:hypothetical protein